MNTYKACKLRIFTYALQVCVYNLDDAFQKFFKGSGYQDVSWEVRIDVIMNYYEKLIRK